MTTVQSIDRAFQVLRALVAAPAGLTELAGRVGLPKSTVARLLGTLEELKAVTREADGKTFRVGMGIVELAGAIDASAALASAMMPRLIGLARAVGEAAGFSVPTGYTMNYLVQVESPNSVQVRDYSGLTVPMHVGPSGLCLMARWPAEELDRYLSRPLESYTPHTIIDPDLIRKRLEEIRDSGHCWIYEEFAEGITSVAAPVLNGEGRVLGAIHVHGPAYRFPPAGTADSIARRVMEAGVGFSIRRTSLKNDTMEVPLR
jgi:IclR family acetate operon transcriptional repressor